MAEVGNGYPLHTKLHHYEASDAAEQAARLVPHDGKPVAFSGRIRYYFKDDVRLCRKKLSFLANCS